MHFSQRVDRTMPKTHYLTREDQVVPMGISKTINRDSISTSSTAAAADDDDDDYDDDDVNDGDDMDYSDDYTKYYDGPNNNDDKNGNDDVTDTDSSISEVSMSKKYDPSKFVTIHLHKPANTNNECHNHSHCQETQIEDAPVEGENYTSIIVGNIHPVRNASMKFEKVVYKKNPIKPSSNLFVSKDLSGRIAKIQQKQRIVIFQSKDLSVYANNVSSEEDIKLYESLFKQVNYKPKHRISKYEKQFKIVDYLPNKATRFRSNELHRLLGKK